MHDHGAARDHLPRRTAELRALATVPLRADVPSAEILPPIAKVLRRHPVELSPGGSLTVGKECKTAHESASPSHAIPDEGQAIWTVDAIFVRP